MKPTFETNYSTMKTILFYASIALIITACSSLTPAQKTSLNNLAAAVEPLVAQYALTGKVDYAQSIPVALNSIAVFVPDTTVNKADLNAKIQTVISDFTNGTAGTTQQKVAKAILDVLPAQPTGSQVNTALVTAGIGASNGANP